MRERDEELARSIDPDAWRKIHKDDADWCQQFADLVRADERGQIEDEWSMCVQSDLEHGVKCLNEQAAKDWFKNYPKIAKFGAWLSAKGNT